MTDYAATNHASKQDLSVLELKVAATYATRTELREVEQKLNETATLTERIEERLGGIARSVNDMSANITRLFWTVIGSVFLAVVSKVMGWW